MVIGSYITMLPPGSTIEHFTPIAVAVVAGILISNLLFLNEFPDYEADAKTGRKHIVIILGRKRASKVYVFLLALAYVWIVIMVALNLLPKITLLSLLTVPVAIKAGKGCLKYYDEVEKLIPSLAGNVIVTLITPTLLALGLLIAYTLRFYGLFVLFFKT